MSSQLVDFDGDGYNDILVGSFCGVPQLIKGSREGFSKPEPITDQSGETVLIANFWNYDTEKWDTTDRAGSEGHCTSVAAVDWDADGDLDLLLGDYYGGRLYLRENQGDAKTPKFARANQPVMAGDEGLVIEHGLAAPRVIDWDGDGLFDILCGGAKGGVYFFRNQGNKTTPKFGTAETLIAPVHDESQSYVRRVPSKDGQPTMPGSSYHIDPVDFDGDGDLDLLVGARCSWQKDAPSNLTDQQKREAEQLDRRYAELLQQLQQMLTNAKTDEARQALVRDKSYRKLIAEYQEVIGKRKQYDTDPTATGDFVWFFRRK